MRGTAKRWATLKWVRRTACGVAVPKRMRRIMCCMVMLALCLLLCGDMALQPRQDPLLLELRAVEQQLRALTAGAPDGWRYSLRVSPGPDGTAALTADAARRDASGAWETIHTLWVPENGIWRMVRQTYQTHRPPPGVGGSRE